MSQTEFEFTEADKARAETVAERILAMLQAGPTLSTDLVGITHRFSASIRILRERGYSIAVERMEDHTSLHTLTGYTPMVQVTDEMQAAYYLTLHWQQRRLERKEFDGHRCCWCHSTGVSSPLHVHHWHYDLFNESLEDLMTLCETCHTNMHENNAVRVHFPRYVSQEIADRLLGIE